MIVHQHFFRSDIVLAIHSHASSSSSCSSASYSSSWRDPERRPCQEPGTVPCDKASACEPCGQQNFGHKVRNLFPPSLPLRHTFNVSQCLVAHTDWQTRTLLLKLTDTALKSLNWKTPKKKAPPPPFFKVITSSLCPSEAAEQICSTALCLRHSIQVRARNVSLANTQTHADLIGWGRAIPTSGACTDMHVYHRQAAPNTLTIN